MLQRTLLSRLVFPRPWRQLLLALLLVLAAVLPELPALHGEFQWDDEPHISKNLNLTDAAGLLRTWTQPTSNMQYYPLAITAFWLEYHCFGLVNLAGYHLVNMLVHGINAVLVWLVLRKLRLPWAWLIALLFAIHPMTVESVAYLSELKNLLSAAFFLLATLLWLRWVPQKGRAGAVLYVGIILAFAAAMLAKSTACTLPAVLIVLAGWRYGRSVPRRVVLGIIPLLLIAAALSAMFIWMEHTHVGAHGKLFAFGPIERLLIAGRAAWFYVGKFLWPFPLLTIYPRWTISPADPAAYLFPLLLLALFACLWWMRRRLGVGPFVAALLIILLLAPSLGFISFYPMLFSFVADHYAYLALIPLAAIAILALRAVALYLLPRRLAQAQIIVAILLLLLLVPMTFHQAARWRTQITLWEPTVAGNPHSWIADALLAYAYIEHDRYPEARHFAEASLALNDQNSRAHFTLARALFSLGNPVGAVGEYQRGLSLEPSNAVAWFDEGLALEKLGRFPDAETAYRRVTDLDPSFARPWNNLAALAARRGDWSAAATAAGKAVEIDPGYGIAYVNLGLALEKLNRPADAIDPLRRGINLLPENPRLRLELAHLLIAANDRDGAVAQYHRILQDVPAFTQAQMELQALERMPPTSRPTH